MIWSKPSRMKSEQQIDTGYAWVALTCSCIMSGLVNGFWASFGVIFVEWEIYFDVTPASTSKVGSACLLIIWGIGPVVSAICKRLTHRVVVVFAGIIVVSCLFALTFITQFWNIYIIMPIFGIGLGLCAQPAFTFYIYFFDKYLATATAIKGSASGLGILGLPPIMEYLISTYGWRGAFQITAALMANLSVCGLLMKKPKPKKPHRIKTISETLTRRISIVRPHVSTNPLILFARDVARDLDVSLFRNIRFVVHVIIGGILRGGYAAAVVYLVPYSVSVGTSNVKSSFVILAYGIAGMLIQLSPLGLLVDKNCITAANLSGIAHVLMGVILAIISFTTNYTMLIILAVLFGCMQGVGSSMYYVVMANSAGSQEKGPAAGAWYLLQSGIGSMLVVFFVGFLYDYTGNYTWSMILCGATLFLVGTNLFCDSCLIRRQNRRVKSTDEEYPKLFMLPMAIKREFYLETSV